MKKNMKSKHKLRKRLEKRNVYKSKRKLRMFGVNAAGIKSKQESLNEILKRLQPQIWAIQETKLKPNEKITCDAVNSFQMFYLYRQESGGGGLALGIDKDIESTLVREGNDDIEAIVVQAVLGTFPVRIIVAYGPQENSLKEKKEKFWEFLEEETNKAELEGNGLIIQMDGNLHGGPEVIKNDPNQQNKNGNLFMHFLERNPFLSVGNNLDICKGTITRRRVLENRTEQAILDFFIMNDKMLSFLSNIIIDEDRSFTLSNFSQFKKNKRVIETDHNLMYADFDVSIPKRKPQRIELFNLRNKDCQAMFTTETTENSQLIKCFENMLPFENQCKMWLKTFNSLLYKCFRKIRVVKNDKKITQNDILLRERIELKNRAKSPTIDEEMKRKIEERITQIEANIGNDISEKYKNEIMDTLQQLGGDRKNLSGSGRKKLWEILKRKYPKCAPGVPVGKKDKFGNLITNHEGLKKLYLETYIHRLRNRHIKDELKEIKKLKEELFELRLELSKCNKSAPWTMDQLEVILKHLKHGKARDPNGWSNELFSNEVAGMNLKLSMLTMFNKMKEKNNIPDFMRSADVATIYKGKGEKHDLENDRGIFLVTIFRSILMRLIYMDKYSLIDSNMSDYQVGGRKGENVRTTYGW